MATENKPEFCLGDRVEIIDGVKHVGRQGEIIEVYDGPVSMGDRQYIYEIRLDDTLGPSELVGRYEYRLKLIEPAGCKTHVSTESLMEVLNV